jgi:transketolase
MRKMCLDMVYELAQKDKRVFFIGSDLGFGTLDNFKEEMPDRFFMEGISESNIVGMSAGLAMEGKIPYVNTIATFLTRRCFEQVVLDLCLHNVNVRLLGNGGGCVYAPLGPTHQAIDDIAIMRAVPNMTIVAPADADEMKRLMNLTLDYQGPIYIRFGKGYDPIVTTDEHIFRIGKGFTMREGADALLITTGITLKLALSAAESLSHVGIECTVLHMPTIKPLDIEKIIELATPVRMVITIEEHSIIGGLGSAVAEIMAETNWSSPKRFKRLGIPDVFPDKYGTQASLMEYYNISEDAIINTVQSFSAA